MNTDSETRLAAQDRHQGSDAEESIAVGIRRGLRSQFMLSAHELIRRTLLSVRSAFLDLCKFISRLGAGRAAW
jgi:hypothetical protein